MKTFKSYSELIKLPTFMERFEYLKIGGKIGEATFGSKRYLNQVLYTSNAWRSLRDDIIVRDDGNDLGVDGYDIGGLIYIHHLNPITIEDIKNRRPLVLDPENLICVSRKTHEAIHFGDASLLPDNFAVERFPRDTCLW